MGADRGAVKSRTAFDDTTREHDVLQPVSPGNPLPVTGGVSDVHTNALLANLCDIGERILEQLHEITGLDN